MSVVLDPETVIGDEEERVPLKSIACLKSCICGYFAGYVTIGHVPIAFEPDDPQLQSFAKTEGWIVDAPPDAELYSRLKGTATCRDKLRS